MTKKSARYWKKEFERIVQAHSQLGARNAQLTMELADAQHRRVQTIAVGDAARNRVFQLEIEVIQLKDQLQKERRRADEAQAHSVMTGSANMVLVEELRQTRHALLVLIEKMK